MAIHTDTRVRGGVLLGGLVWTLFVVVVTAQEEALDPVPLAFVFVGLLGVALWSAVWAVPPDDAPSG